MALLQSGTPAEGDGSPRQLFPGFGGDPYAGERTEKPGGKVRFK
jgi:hypothetical protein